jgi:hypothetical protein
MIFEEFPQDTQDIGEDKPQEAFIPMAEEPKKTRKPRTPKAPGKPTKKDADLSTAVYTVGALIVGLIGKPELALQKEETDAIAQAANKVASYYDLPDGGLIGAWVNLGLTLGAVIYPRYAVIMAERKQSKDNSNE